MTLVGPRIVATRPAGRCAICHDDLAPSAGRACGACATRGHRACLAEVGRCPTLGCPGEPRLPILVLMGSNRWSPTALETLHAVALTAVTTVAGILIGLGFVMDGPATAVALLVGSTLLLWGSSRIAVRLYLR